MNPARAGWHTLAIFAILFLLGFGFVVYAVPGVANVAPMSSGNSSAPAASPAQSENVYYRLVQVATTAEGAPGANASGYAGISISGQSLSLEWSVSDAAPAPSWGRLSWARLSPAGPSRRAADSASS